MGAIPASLSNVLSSMSPVAMIRSGLVAATAAVSIEESTEGFPVTTACSQVGSYPLAAVITTGCTLREQDGIGITGPERGDDLGRLRDFGAAVHVGESCA